MRQNIISKLHTTHVYKYTEIENIQKLIGLKTKLEHDEGFWNLVMTSPFSPPIQPISLSLSACFHWQLCVYPGQKQHSHSRSVLVQTQQPIHRLKNKNKPLKTSNWAIKAFGEEK